MDLPPMVDAGTAATWEAVPAYRIPLQLERYHPVWLGQRAVFGLGRAAALRFLGLETPSDPLLFGPQLLLDEPFARPLLLPFQSGGLLECLNSDALLACPPLLGNHLAAEEHDADPVSQS